LHETRHQRLSPSDVFLPARQSRVTLESPPRHRCALFVHIPWAGSSAAAISGSGRRGNQNFGIGWPKDLQAATSVLAISMAMVIGPTPPGTGVMAPATAAHSS